MVKRFQLTLARWKQGYKMLSKRALKQSYLQRKRLAKAGAVLMIVGTLGNLVSLPLINRAFADAARFDEKVMRVWDPATSTWKPDSQYDPGISFKVNDTVSLRALARNIVINTMITNPTLKISQATVTNDAIEVTSTLNGEGTPGAFNDKVIIRIADAKPNTKYKLEFSPTYQRNHCTDVATSCPDGINHATGNTSSLLAGTVIAPEIPGGEQYSILWNAKIVGENPDPTPNPTVDQKVPVALTLGVNPTTILENSNSHLQISGVLQNNTDITLTGLNLFNTPGVNTKNDVTYGNDLLVTPLTGNPTLGTVDVVQNSAQGIGLKPNEAVTFTYGVTSNKLAKDTLLQFESYVQGEQIDDNQAVTVATVVADNQNQAEFTLTHEIKKSSDAAYSSKATVAPGETADVRVTLVNNSDVGNGYFLAPVLTETNAAPKSAGLNGPVSVTLNGQPAQFAGSRLNFANLKKGDSIVLTYKYTAKDAASYPTNTTTFTIQDRGTNNNDNIATLKTATPDPLTLVVQKDQQPPVDKAIMVIDSKIKESNGTLVDRATRKPGEAVEFHVFIGEQSNKVDIQDYMTKVINADPRLIFQGVQQGPQFVGKGTGLSSQNPAIELVFAATVADTSKFANPGTHTLSTQFEGTSKMHTLSATTTPDLVDVVVEANQEKPSVALELQVHNLDFPAGDIKVNGKVYKTERALPGNRIQYAATVTNNGNTDLTNVKLADVLPAELSDLKAAALNGTTAEFTIASLKKGETQTFTYEGRVINKKVAYTFANTANVTTGNLNVTSNEAIVSVTAPVLSMTHTVDKTTAKTGDTVTYTVTVKNTGETPATNVTVDYTVDKGLTFKSGEVKGSQHTVTNDKDNKHFTATWTTMNPGEEATMTIVATVNSDVPTRTTLTNSAVLAFKDTVGNDYDKIKLDASVLVEGATTGTKTSKITTGTTTTGTTTDANREGRVLGATTTPKTGAGTVGLSILISAFLTLLAVGGYVLMKKAKSLDNLDLSYIEFV